AARHSQNARCDAQVATGQTGADVGSVEADAVGDVVNLPCEAEVSVFPDLPGLGQAGVDGEVTIATEVVALAGFTRIWQTNISAPASAAIDAAVHCLRILEILRVAVGIVVFLGLDWAGLHAVAFDLPVGCPSGLVEAEGQAAG